MDKPKNEVNFLADVWIRNISSIRSMSICKKILVHTLIIFLVLVTIGLSQFRNYGISFDEPAMRMHGISTAKYVADIFVPTLSENLSSNPIYESVPDAATHHDGATHQVFFELGLVLMEYSLGLTYDKKTLYELRHLATFLFCSFGLVVFFVFLYWRFRSLRLAYLGVFLIVLSPRIFADMFYNNKDAVFMTTYLIAGVTSVYAIVRRSRVSFILSAVAIGLSISTRVVGVIPAILIYISILFFYKDLSFFNRVKKVVQHGFLTISCTVLFHPYYWNDPIHKLIEAFVVTARYPYRSCTLTLGRCLDTTSLPWFYVPVWVSVTIPLVFLIVFVLGIFRFQFDLFSKIRNSIKNDTPAVIDLLMLSLLVLPLFIVVLSQTTLYNGWRHLFFIYPFLAYFGVRFFSYSTKTLMKRSQIVLSILVLFTFASTASWMYANRPLQNLYFNQLAGGEIATKWELDYFSLSNRQALEWILARDSREKISIQTSDNSPLYDSAVFLSKEDIVRADFLWYEKGVDDADYVIVRQDLSTESRQLRKTLNSQEAGFKLVYKRSIGNTEIFSIYEKIVR